MSLPMTVRRTVTEFGSNDKDSGGAAVQVLF